MRRAGIAGICLVLLAALARSQDPSQEKRPTEREGPSFSATVYTVLVDVVATARDKPVTDLRPDEFRLFEDGVEQTIDALEIQTVAGPQVIRLSEGEEREPAPVPARTNLITFLLDYTTTEFANQKYVREAATKYIEETIGPNDAVAIFSTGGGGSLRALQGFTSDKQLLVAALSRGDVAGSAYRGERAQLSADIGGAGRAGQSEPGLSASAAGSSGFVPAQAASGAATGSSRAQAMLAQRIEASFLALRAFTDAMLARPILTAIKSIALVQKEIPGRKTLVLFSEGFVVPPNVENVMKDAVDAANRANLAIYTVDTQGLYTRDAGTRGRGELESINAAQGRARLGSAGGESLFDRARQVGSDQNESTLRYVSNSTGGFLIRNTNDFQIGLQRIDEDIRTYYLLSYRPRNLDFDGKFRELKVEVTRPGVRIRARHGYFAIPPSDTLLSPDQRTLFDRARRVGSGGLALLAEASGFFPAAAAPAAVVTVEVSTDALQFTENQALFEDTLEILGLVTDSGGNSVTTFGRPLPLLFNREQLDAVRGGFITHSENLVLDPGRYRIEVVVQEPATGKVGYYAAPLPLEAPESFRLSDLVISRQVVNAIPESSFDPLVAGEAKIVPSANRTFRNGDLLVFYFDVYRATARQGRCDVSVTLSLLKDGRPFPVKLPGYVIREPLAGKGARVQVSKYLELAGLPPGAYSLKVSALDNHSGASGDAQNSFTLSPE